MKKTCCYRIWLAALLAMVLASCGEDGRENLPTEKAKQQEVFVLRLGHDLPESSAQHLAAERFAERVSERSNGRLRIEIFPAQQLGNDLEMIEMARSGRLDIILPPTAKLSAFIPAMQIIDLPFLFDNKAEAYQVLDGPAGTMLLQQLNNIGLVGVGFWESGYKQLSLDRPLENASTLEGLKLRIMPSEVLRSQFEEWGASAIPIEFAKTHDALAEGVVNGQENPLGSIYNMKFHEVQTNIILSNHGYLSQVLAISEKTMDKLPSDLREILITSGIEVTDYQRSEVSRLEQEFLNKLKASGSAVDELDQATRDELKSRSKNVLEKYRMKIGSAVIERFQQEIDEVRGYDRDGVIIGLDADLAGSSYLSGLAIRRGIEIAINEINETGGVLGRKMHLIARDNSMVSARGIDNITKFAEIRNLVAVFGGISSPVALSEIDIIHDKKILFLDPWAAATNIVDNNKSPNYVFRVSVRDEYAGGFLLSKALQISKNVGLLLTNDGWGRSNHQAISEAIAKHGVSLVNVQWFDWSDEMFGDKIDKLIAEGAGVIIYVGNTIEGARLVKHMAAREKQVPIVSHWGVAGSDFYELTDGAVSDIDFQVLQTFSFMNNSDAKALGVVKKYQQAYHVDSAEEIVAAVGTAHAYDLVYLLAAAIRKADSFDMPRIRDAMERLDQYDGLVRRYRPPFTQDRHDALNTDDFFLARYQGRALVKQN